MQRLRLRRAPAPRTVETGDDHPLKFPTGGVFGLRGPGNDRPSWRSDVGREVEATLDRMQQQLDDLKDDVDQVLHLPTGRPWSPSAA